MTEIRLDPYLSRYAARTRGMTASEIRALFAVASRPEVIFLAGGMPYTSALDYDAITAVTTEVIQRDGPAALQYGGGQGYEPLRERLVAVMEAEGIDAYAGDIVVTAGGQQALDLVAKLLCDPGDVILAEGPSYVGALGAFGAYEADVVHVPMDRDGLIPQALLDTLERLRHERRRPKFCYTVPNHQNPAGVSLSASRRRELADIAERHDLLIVEDNPYGLLDFKAEIRPSLRSLAADRVIYIGTLSKIFSPGIRVGWVLAPAAIREKLILLKEAADLCQSNLSQYVAERWFATQPWLRQVEQFRDVYRERCEAMLEGMTQEFPDGCTWSVPTGGFFVWAQLPEGIDTGDLLAKAIQARVAYVPGRAFYANGEGGRHLRLGFCFASPEQIREGIRRLAEVIHAELELAAVLYPSPNHRS